MIVAAIDGAVAVGLGAFGAHGLKDVLEATGRADTWRTAAHYQLVHAAALLALAVWMQLGVRKRAADLVGLLWITGTVLFSGSLYAVAVGAKGGLGILAPIGGLCFIAGWLGLCFAGRESSAAPRVERN